MLARATLLFIKPANAPQKLPKKNNKTEYGSGSARVDDTDWRRRVQAYPLRSCRPSPHGILHVGLLWMGDVCRKSYASHRNIEGKIQVTDELCLIVVWGLFDVRIFECRNWRMARTWIAPAKETYHDLYGEQKSHRLHAHVVVVGTCDLCIVLIDTCHTRKLIVIFYFSFCIELNI